MMTVPDKTTDEKMVRMTTITDEKTDTSDTKEVEQVDQKSSEQKTAWETFQKDRNVANKVTAVKELLKTEGFQPIWILESLLTQKYFEMQPSLLHGVGDVIRFAVNEKTPLHHLNFLAFFRSVTKIVKTGTESDTKDTSAENDVGIEYFKALQHLVSGLSEKGCLSMDLAELLLDISRTLVEKYDKNMTISEEAVLCVLNYYRIAVEDTPKIKRCFESICNALIPFLCTNLEEVERDLDTEEVENNSTKSSETSWPASIFDYCERTIYSNLFLREHIVTGFNQLYTLKQAKKAGDKKVKTEYDSYQKKIFECIKDQLSNDNPITLTTVIPSLYRAFCVRTDALCFEDDAERYMLLNTNLTGIGNDDDEKEGGEKENTVAKLDYRKLRTMNQRQRKKEEAKGAQTSGIGLKGMNVNPKYMFLEEIHEILVETSKKSTKSDKKTQILVCLNDIWDLAREKGGYKVRDQDGTLLSDYIEHMLSELMTCRKSEPWRALTIALAIDPACINVEDDTVLDLVFGGQTVHDTSDCEERTSALKFYGMLLTSYVKLSDAGSVVKRTLEYFFNNSNNSDAVTESCMTQFRDILGRITSDAVSKIPAIQSEAFLREVTTFAREMVKRKGVKLVEGSMNSVLSSVMLESILVCLNLSEQNFKLCEKLALPFLNTFLEEHLSTSSSSSSTPPSSCAASTSDPPVIVETGKKKKKRKLDVVIQDDRKGEDNAKKAEITAVASKPRASRMAILMKQNMICLVPALCVFLRRCESWKGTDGAKIKEIEKALMVVVKARPSSTRSFECESQANAVSQILAITPEKTEEILTGLDPTVRGVLFSRHLKLLLKNKSTSDWTKGGLVKCEIRKLMEHFLIRDDSNGLISLLLRDFSYLQSDVLDFLISKDRIADVCKLPAEMLERCAEEIIELAEKQEDEETGIRLLASLPQSVEKRDALLFEKLIDTYENLPSLFCHFSSTSSSSKSSSSKKSKNVSSKKRERVPAQEENFKLSEVFSNRQDFIRLALALVTGDKEVLTENLNESEEEDINREFHKEEKNKAKHTLRLGSDSKLEDSETNLVFQLIVSMIDSDRDAFCQHLKDFEIPNKFFEAATAGSNNGIGVYSFLALIASWVLWEKDNKAKYGDLYGKLYKEKPTLGLLTAVLPAKLLDSTKVLDLSFNEALSEEFATIMSKTDFSEDARQESADQRLDRFYLKKTTLDCASVWESCLKSDARGCAKLFESEKVSWIQIAIVFKLVKKIPWFVTEAVLLRLMRVWECDSVDIAQAIASVFPHTTRSHSQRNNLTGIVMRLATDAPEYGCIMLNAMFGASSMMFRKAKKNQLTGKNSEDLGMHIVPAWVKQVAPLLQVFKKLMKYAIHDSVSGVEALERSNKVSRLLETFARGGPILGSNIFQRHLQKGIKKYVGYLVAYYITLDRQQTSIESKVEKWARLHLQQNGGVDNQQSNQRSRRVETARWVEAREVMERAINPLLSVMGDAEKQSLYCSLNEQMRNRFKEMQATFKARYEYKGKV